jgi:hypothetical protein
MTVTTSASVAAGSYPITVTAAGGGRSKSTTFNLTVGQSQVAAPTISPNGGSFTGPVNVTLQAATSGAAIYYTTNGTTPSPSSTLYAGPLTLASSATIKAIAIKTGSSPSTIASAAFTIAATTPAKLTLAWEDNSTGEESFEIQRKTGSAGTFGQIAEVGVNVESYVDTNVTRGVTYCYRLRATNSSTVSGYSSEACGAIP